MVRSEIALDSRDRQESCGIVCSLKRKEMENKPAWGWDMLLLSICDLKTLSDGSQANLKRVGLQVWNPVFPTLFTVDCWNPLGLWLL